jgi:predicted PhzF superfamily epimerase YddE/YHI9
MLPARIRPHRSEARRAAGGGSELDFVSRVFCPWAGIDEDAVTGSAHAVLAPFWQQRLGAGGRPLRARQCSPRGGEMTCDVQDSCVQLHSSAVIVLKGSLLLAERC